MENGLKTSALQTDPFSSTRTYGCARPQDPQRGTTGSPQGTVGRRARTQTGSNTEIIANKGSQTRCSCKTKCQMIRRRACTCTSMQNVLCKHTQRKKLLCGQAQRNASLFRFVRDDPMVAAPKSWYAAACVGRQAHHNLCQQPQWTSTSVSSVASPWTSAEQHLSKAAFSD